MSAGMLAVPGTALTVPLQLLYAILALVNLRSRSAPGHLLVFMVLQSMYTGMEALRGC